LTYLIEFLLDGFLVEIFGKRCDEIDCEGEEIWGSAEAKSSEEERFGKRPQFRLKDLVLITAKGAA
jgi:hypothetical protein